MNACKFWEKNLILRRLSIIEKCSATWVKSLFHNITGALRQLKLYKKGVNLHRVHICGPTHCVYIIVQLWFVLRVGNGFQTKVTGNVFEPHTVFLFPCSLMRTSGLWSHISWAPWRWIMRHTFAYCLCSQTWCIPGRLLWMPGQSLLSGHWDRSLSLHWIAFLSNFPESSIRHTDGDLMHFFNLGNFCCPWTAAKV